MGKIVVVIAAVVLGLILPRSHAGAGERAFSWSQAPGKGDYVGVNLKSYNLSKYLEECQLNRPEIVNDVKAALDSGKYYRKNTKDQRGKQTRITVNVNPDYQLRIVTYRNETCPECGGKGYKDLPFGKLTTSVDAGLSCWKCKGDGEIKDHTTEKYFILSPEDFEDAKLGRELMQGMAYKNAPSGAEEWVEALVSKNPAQRLEACEWLDKHYVKIGAQFTTIDPMLRKARYHETNDKKKIMVWQFWAGKDDPRLRKRGFYRIYANAKTGKITEKGFYEQR